MTLTVYFLSASRCIRTLWLVEELGIAGYELRCQQRENKAAPPAFKRESGNPLGKFPTIRDGDLVIHESGAITEYLCEKYDTQHRLIPAQQPERTRVQQWIHAAEGSLLLHSLAVLYASWHIPDSVSEEDRQKLYDGMGKNVRADLDWIQAELEKSSGKFLVGDTLTAADIMMEFSLDFTLIRQLGTGGKTWPRIQEYLDMLHALPSYQKAVEASGYSLE